ncbi:MAG: phosphoribosylglycinamide formyltransferase [Pseudomonadota bacterium]
MRRVAVLISGRGSNLAALLAAAATGGYEICGVISNRPDAPGLALARDAAVPTTVVDHRKHSGRAAFDAALQDALDPIAADWIVLAGFMRILTDAFVLANLGRMVNIHPSLLPRYTGLHTHARALEAGDELHGASVHFVTPELDGGPVIAQVPMAILPGDTPVILAERLLPLEHRLLVACVRELTSGSIRLVDGKAVRSGGRLEFPLVLGDDDQLAARTLAVSASP